ncbi:MAG: DUF1587 domain-containing protein, partial [Planctomycetales bacterium]|nr:DUF1587 domain-containing protein [Planctomycetales bacterium]
MRRVLVGIGILAIHGAAAIAQPNDTKTFRDDIRPLLARYCLACHSAGEKQGELDLEQYQSLDDVRRRVKPWQAVAVQLEAREMPPKDERQPTAEERQRLVSWTEQMLAAEARARAGDPGRRPLRRLSHAEYDNTVRDLTGVDLRPAREFPADGAAGEGFTNAAEALSMSPTLMSKYMDTAKRIASHAVLLPDGFRFSPHQTRRDQTDESVARIRDFYARYTADGEGRLPVDRYLAALFAARESLSAGSSVELEAIARQKNLQLPYLRKLWQTLNEPQTSYPLNRLQSSWRNSTEASDVAREIAMWQAALWKFARVGSYRHSESGRQEAASPELVTRQTLRFEPDVQPGQAEVTLRLASRDLSTGAGGYVIWQRPRFEAGGQTRLLRDYAEFGPAYELDFARLFGNAARYLAAATEHHIEAEKSL